MPITINGSGSVTGLSAGGLPDDCITTADIAANAVTTAKLGTNDASGLAKAWVNWNGTGTVAIRASFNVSSITDNGTGDYTVNFTTAITDANYSAVYGMGDNTISVGMAYAQTATFSTSVHRVMTANRSTGSLQDQNYIGVAIFR